MTRRTVSSILVVLSAATLSLLLAALSAASAQLFSVKQYEEFHDVLHPLEHEALPSKDFARIRSNADKLVKRGRAIVKLGVPKNTAQKDVDEFRRELRKFSKALSLFDRAARRGDDTQLENSFSAVHDSYEMLAGMLPRNA